MKTMFSCLCFSMGNLLPFFVIGEPACHIEHLERHEIAERSSCWKLPQCPQMPNDHCGHKQASLLHDGSQFDLGSFWASGYSQVGQDGVLWALFNVLGAGGKYYVEFGVQAGCERNTRWLAERCGWSGLLLDGGFQNSSIGLHQAFISAANIVALLQKYQVPKNIDLLSIDIDGQDWHVWHALGEAGYRPRVLVIEYSSQLGYPGDLVRPRKDDSPGNGFGNHVLCMQHAREVQVFSEGSSAEAFERLGCHFGYTIVHIHPPDMYFVRNDVLAPHHTRFAHLEKGIRWMERRYNPNPQLTEGCTLLLQGHGMLPAALLLGGQRHRDTETQRHRDTETQIHRDTQTRGHHGESGVGIVEASTNSEDTIRPLSQWHSIDDIVAFLQKLDLAQYAGLFSEFDVPMFRYIAQFPQELQALGVHDVRHRAKIGGHMKHLELNMM
mmetsp:Transcript_38511/g.67954  ORF Transcript_38511/g.67954 Transcript_38511/m.67954 type:complete len:439 (+) Transcript_38511:26-1342(+)